MNQYVDVFLKEVLEKVKYKKIHPYLAQELNDHIELLKEDIMEIEGLCEEAAYKKAVAQMGAPEEIGEGLHKTHKTVMEWWLLGIMVLLIGFSGIVLTHYMRLYNNDYNLVLKQGILASIAVIGTLFIIFKVKYTLIEKYTYVMYGIGIILMLLTLSIGREYNGAKRWLQIGPMMIQTCSIAVPLFIVSFIGFVRKWGNDGIRGYLKIELILLAATGLCMVEYFTQGMILLISCIFIMIAYTYTSDFKGNRKSIHRIFALCVSSFCVGIVLVTVTVPYRLERILTFINPERDPMEGGYIILHLRETIANARWFGNTIGTNPLYSPYSLEGKGELIFNFIIGGMGIFAALVIALCSILLLIRCFKMAYEVRENYGKLVLYGISIYFTVQFIMSVTFSLGLLPLGMCNLPFISYSGTNLIMNMVMIGIAVSVYRYKNIAPYELLQTQHITEEKRERDISTICKDLFKPIEEDNALEQFNIEIKNR